MSNKKYLSFLNFKGSLLEIRDKFARNNIGLLESLKTNDKSSIVAAINEIFNKVKISPVAKTNDMTQEVGVDENGKLFTSPYTLTTDKGLNKSDIAADGATVGNYFKSLTLGKADDALIYIFLNNKPIGTGLRLSNELTPQIDNSINGSIAVIADNNNVVKSSITNRIYSASDPTDTINSSISDGILFVNGQNYG